MIVENNVHNHLKALFYLMWYECEDYEEMKESSANFIDPGTETYTNFMRLLEIFYEDESLQISDVDHTLELLLTGAGNSATIH